MTLEILTSDLLAPVRHGFFTRRGGASSGVFHGLNCGQGSSDQSEIVAINRSRVAASLGLAAQSLVTVHQVHSATAVPVETPFDTPPRADAMVTATPGLALGVLSADCQPVLFADVRAGVIGAAHAGWRGALDGVLEATLDAMEALGAAREDVHAVIGPTISQSAYEVGPEFVEDFMAEDPQSARFFGQGKGDRVYSEKMACARCAISFPELTPQAFSFNSPQGMCDDCNGLGTRVEMDLDLVIPDADDDD